MQKNLLINLFDYEKAAAAKLPPTAYDYYASGGGDEITLRENHAAYERIKLKPRVLKDISKIDLSQTLLGQPRRLSDTTFDRLLCGRR